jgi:HTH-type transcriptional regulator / antitoxin HigA
MESQMNLRSDSKAGFGALVNAWSSLHQRTKIGVIRSEAEYDRMVKLLDALVDKVGDNENHELAGLLDLVGVLIERYEEDRISIPEASPSEVLRFLMQEHGLRQADLKKELGSQGVVSEILNGHRLINARQAKALAERFSVSASVFL